MIWLGVYAYLETEVELDAAPQDAWRVLVDFDSWPDWHKSDFMRFTAAPKAAGHRCALVTALREGALKGTTHHPMVEVMSAGRELMWRDFSLLLAPFWSGRHWFRLDPLPGGRARLRHGTRQAGLALPFLRGAIRSTELGYRDFNNELAAEVARRFPARGAAREPAAVPGRG